MAVIHAETLTLDQTEAGLQSPVFYVPATNPRPFALAEHIAQIRDTVDLIRQGNVLAKSLEMLLEEDLTAVRGIIVATKGTVTIEMPDRVRDYARAEPLINDYLRYSDEYGHHLVVPTARITAVNTLPFAGGPGNFDPVLDMRIQSSADRPLSTYAGPGNVIETPSPGSWHRFPLQLVDLSVHSIA